MEFSLHGVEPSTSPCVLPQATSAPGEAQRKASEQSTRYPASPGLSPRGQRISGGSFWGQVERSMRLEVFPGARTVWSSCRRSPRTGSALAIPRASWFSCHRQTLACLMSLRSVPLHHSGAQLERQCFVATSRSQLKPSLGAELSATHTLAPCHKQALSRARLSFVHPAEPISERGCLLHWPLGLLLWI